MIGSDMGVLLGDFELVVARDRAGRDDLGLDGSGDVAGLDQQRIAFRIVDPEGVVRAARDDRFGVRLHLAEQCVDVVEIVDHEIETS